MVSFFGGSPWCFSSRWDPRRLAAVVETPQLTDPSVWMSLDNWPGRSRPQRRKKARQFFRVQSCLRQICQSSATTVLTNIPANHLCGCVLLLAVSARHDSRLVFTKAIALKPQKIAPKLSPPISAHASMILSESTQSPECPGRTLEE